MKTTSARNCGTANARVFPNVRFFYLSSAIALSMAIIGLTGCQSHNTAAVASSSSQMGSSEPQTIREGDVIKVSFPGATNLDSSQTVRRDGRITLTMMGEMKVVGKTPAELEKEILATYGSQLVSKEVTVSVVSSSFAVFVSGAVIRPGKVTSDHPMTALEAIMEASGFDSAKANMQAVVVIRNEDGKTKNYTLNLKQVLDGQSNEPFYLKPSDIIFVPEKFSWF